MKPGAETTNKFYNRWKGMVNRCHNEDDPAFESYGNDGVTVCDEWRSTPTAFFKWCEKENPPKSYFLDKDIKCKEQGIYPHIYSPTTCMFIPRLRNNQATRKIKRGNTTGYRGISKLPETKDSWLARICVNGKRVLIGYYPTKLIAAKAYDSYIVNNNLHHTTNDVLEVGEHIEMAPIRLRPQSKSGERNICFKVDRQKFVVTITQNKITTTVGHFKTLEEAITARDEWLDNRLKGCSCTFIKEEEEI